MNNKSIAKYNFGMVGLGTMGRNLLFNMADNGFAVTGYDKSEQMLQKLEEEGAAHNLKGFSIIEDFVNSLQSPRTIILLVPAGAIVDSVIAELQPLLAKGDIIIDSGNSHFTDTSKREIELKKAKLVEVNDFPPDVVRLDSKVKIKAEGKQDILELMLVMPDKADIKQRRISIMAPIGTALLGFRQGQVVKWQVPSGKKKFTIVEVAN